VDCTFVFSARLFTKPQRFAFFCGKTNCPFGPGAALLGTVPSHPKAHTLAVDPATHAVWLSFTDPSGSYLQEFLPGK